MKIKSETHSSGQLVEVWTDENADNPRRDCDYLGTIVLLKGCRYTFGDETASNDELQTLSNRDDLIALPVYIYDHSGITINTTGFACPWDSYQIGIIYMPKMAAVENWGEKIFTAKVREAAIKCLRAEIEDLDNYLTGRVYGWRLFNTEGEEVAACWGYYGYPEYCLSDGIELAEQLAEVAK